MLKSNTRALAFAMVMGVTAGSAAAQGQRPLQRQALAMPQSVPAPQPAPAPSSGTPGALFVYFPLGGSAIRPEDQAVLDRASRQFRQGKPIVMIVSGSTDTVGSAEGNLWLSERRAKSVLEGLIARGIPADHLQLLAKGQTELAVQEPEGVAEARNRRVEITWR